jgi:hypothetical protein
MRISLALPLLFALAVPALAQGTSIELTDTVAGATGITYFDLAQAIAPDLHETDGRYQGVVTLPVRNLAYPEDPPAAALPLSFYSASAVTFTSGGAELVALLLDADADAVGAVGSAVLAIFDPAHPETPIDVADVASDQHTGFGEPIVLPLGPGDDGIIISSTHSNSSQGYRSTSVLALLAGRLEEMASVFTLSDSYCGVQREQRPILTPANADATARWAPFTITVKETTTVTDVDCALPDAVPGTRMAAASFTWNEVAGAYEPDSSALDDLLAETEARF